MKANRNIFKGLVFVGLIILLSLCSCSTNDADDCGCIRTVYEMSTDKIIDTKDYGCSGNDSGVYSDTQYWIVKCE